MTISERLFIELEKQGKHPADLCRHLKIRTSVTSGWKQRNTDPPAKYILQIASFLGVSVDYLLTGKDGQSSVVISPKDKQEAELLEQYRKLSIYSKALVSDTVSNAYKLEQYLSPNGIEARNEFRNTYKDSII